ncbi:acetyltransferase [Pseudofulvibacter geojedonensis]|uniref:Acetyltransferase n=1 Tax=Pseudofulvibacter geojedonensis TaxID=1123758 RepID=A0ABW3HYI0_9FLAO
MKRLAIIGSGDLGQQIAYYAETDKQYKVVGFFDDFTPKGALVKNIPVLGKIAEIEEAFNNNVFDVILIGIGYKHIEFKSNIYKKLKGVIPFGKLIHSSVIADESAIIADGVVIYPGCLIDAQVEIQENSLLNVAVTVAHDTKIGAHSFLSPRVALAGFCAVGEKNILGINSTVIDNITTVNNVQLGGGTVLINNIEKEGLYVGNPARFIR